MENVDPIRDKAIYYKIKKDLLEWNEKYYIMFLIGTQLALRINEILQLRVGDVKCKAEHTFVQSKTGKEITIAFNPELKAALKQYCAGRDPQEALIPCRDNEYKPLSDKRAWEVISDAGNKRKRNLMRLTSGWTQRMRSMTGWKNSLTTGKKNFSAQPRSGRS